MSRESADADMEDILERTEDLLDVSLNGFGDSYFGKPYGQHALNDATFLLWFDGKMQKDGLFPLALQFVEDGMADIKRWEALSGQEVPRVSDMLPMLKAAGATIDAEMWPIPVGDTGGLNAQSAPLPAGPA